MQDRDGAQLSFFNGIDEEADIARDQIDMATECQLDLGVVATAGHELRLEARNGLLCKRHTDVVIAAEAARSHNDGLFLSIFEDVIQVLETFIVGTHQPQAGVIGVPCEEVEGFQLLRALHVRVQEREDMRNVDDGQLVVVASRVPVIDDLAPRHPTATAGDVGHLYGNTEFLGKIRCKQPERPVSAATRCKRHLQLDGFAGEISGRNGRWRDRGQAKNGQRRTRKKRDFLEIKHVTNHPFRVFGFYYP